MNHQPGPGALRRYLGKELRKLREASGMKTADVVKRAHMSQPTLSGIEGGRRAILPRHVYRLLELYGVEGHDNERLMTVAEQATQPGWWESFADLIPDWFEIYVSLEADATEIWSYESEFVPGWFQTEDYIRALRLAAHPDSAADQLQRSVELRVARQEQMQYEHLSVVLNEAVVRRQVGGRDVMRSQMQRLLAELERGVDLRVLPFDTGAHAAMNGAFIMLRFSDTAEMDLVYVQNERGGTYLERPADLLRHGDIFARTRQAALTTGETAALLSTLVD